MLAEEIVRRNYGVIEAFMDDSKEKIGRKVHGVKVYGPISRTMEYVEKLNVEEIIIAIPSATSEKIKKIISKLVK